MKIVFVSRYLPFPGGRENFVFELSQYLKKFHDIYIITPDGLLGTGVTIFPYVNDREYLNSIIKKIKPDIINSHTFYMCDPLADICKESNIPFILTLHGDQFSIGDKQRQDTVRVAIEKADRIITVCDAGKNSLLKNTGIDKQKLSVIHNGVNLDIFKRDFLSKNKFKSKLRQNTKLPIHKFIFIVPVRMIWYKGLDFMLETIIANKESYRQKDIFFVISVPNTSTSKEEIEYMNQILSALKQENMLDLVKICFSGYEFMPYMYRMADAFILPSKNEQLPISILEAMASQIPVIATKVGGVSEIITDSENGLLVDSGSIQQLDAAIRNIRSSKRLRNKICKTAYKTMLERFSIRISAEKYLANFNQYYDQAK
ncbi:MAG TPA: glycosyltransferase family 4 protein [Clostridia bacterium]